MRWKDWPGSLMACRGSYSDALLRVVKALNETGIRYALTGAAAVGYYGIPRSSMDIDVVISGNLSDAQVEALARALSRNGFAISRDEIRRAVAGGERIMMVKEFKDWVLQLPEVAEAPHRFGGTKFRFQNLEFMHSHGPRHLDIRLSKEDQERMLKEGKAEPHLFAPQAGWVTFLIRSEEDLEAAKELVRLAYDNARKLVGPHAARPNPSRRRPPT